MSAQKAAMTFTQAVADFEDASPWLDAQHAPAVVALRAMAAELDAGMLAPALLGQFGLAYRALQKEQPREPAKDALEAALEAAGVE